MRKNGLPAIGVCPRCAGEFLVTGRTGERIGSLSASDVLEWRCVSCLYAEQERRCLADGIDGDWPVSKFARASVQGAQYLQWVGQGLDDLKRENRP